jgi:bilin biosynthesis protein
LFGDAFSYALNMALPVGPMNNRFANLFGLSEAEAIAVLDKPLDQLTEDDSRYIAASQLAFFPSAESIAALTRAIDNREPSLDNRIVRRKSIESLGKLKAKDGLATIHGCLTETGDTYTIENAAWSIGEIGTEDPEILEALANLLMVPSQSYRAIIHTLAKLDYRPALDRIQSFTEAEDKTIASAALATVYRFTGNEAVMESVMEFLFHPNVYTRRLCIQDLIDTNYYPAISYISQAPVSLVFRMRGLRMLADAGLPTRELQPEVIGPELEKALYDNPKDLQLIHAYDETPAIDRLIQELYETDFARAYLAIKTLVEHSDRSAVGAALLQTYQDKAREDYGAHYHVMKLLGWLRYEPGYDVLVEGLNVSQPQFQKSRAAAAIALGELGNPQAIALLTPCLESPLWDLRYGAILALDKLGDRSGFDRLAEDPDWSIRAKIASLV